MNPPATAPLPPASGLDPEISAVIPVYNSEALVERTVERCRAFFAARSERFEILLVNDGSRDGSWDVVRRLAERIPEVVAIDLVRNYGQHTAVLCGLVHSRGRRVITLDDDLQNPPEEVARLVEAADAGGHDLVFGVPARKRHAPLRRWGSTVVDALNRRVFRKPRNLVLTNFRLIERPVIDRLLSHRTVYPYINGLALLYARKPGNVEVEHRPREVGRSNYGLLQIAELVMRILFNYSSYPLRVVSLAGLVAATVSLAMAGYFLVRALIHEPAVPGWASVAVMLSFFNGLTLLLLGMLGEYTLRILHQVSQDRPYHVAEVVGRGD